MSKNNETLINSLRALGADPILQRKMVELCLEAEKRLSKPGFDVRENITGNIVDAMIEEFSEHQRKLSSGITFNFIYKSKIARDFVMSDDAVPDHVWEPQTTRLLLHLSKKAKHVAIGGAYAGDHAILIADQIKTIGGVCHCFEPNSDQLATLKLNAEMNGLENLELNSCGLWDSDNEQLVLVGEDSFAHPELSTDAQADDSFPTLTLKSYAAAKGAETIDLIMLDIEGAELSALKGAEHFLKMPEGKAPHLVFEVHRNYVDWSNGLAETDIVSYLTNFGYHVYAVRDYQSNKALGFPIEIIKPEKTYLEGPPHGFNMVASKDETIFASEHFKVLENVSPKYLKHLNPKLHQPLSD